MKTVLALLLGLAATSYAQFAVMHTNGVLVSPTNLTIPQSSVAGLASALDSKLGTNPTLAISNTAGLQSALDGKLATNGTLAVSNVSGLQSTLDGKLATNGSAAALTNFPGNLLRHGTNGQVSYTNTNPLTFTNPLLLSGGATNNQPQLLWETDDGIGNGGIFVQGRRFATDLWNSPTNAHTNWSVMYIGQNIITNYGGGATLKNTNMGAAFLTIENEYNWDGDPRDPVSEMYFDVIARNGSRSRPIGAVTSQTNANDGIISLTHATFIQPAGTTLRNTGFGTLPALSIIQNNPTIGGPHLEIINPSTNNTDTRIYINQNNTIGVWLMNNNGMELWRNVEPFRALITSTNGVIIGAASGTTIASRVHLGGNTRIDGAITFDNTTNAATTRTNLGLGSGITTNVTFVDASTNTNSVTISNGIITGWTQ
jgi:hypothetical protein